MEIQRIRLDHQGLLTQDLCGRMRRVVLNEIEVLSVKKMGEPALKALSDTHIELKKFFDRNGKINARFEIAEESLGFLNRPLVVYYAIEPSCNLACTFCGPRDLHSKNERDSKELEVVILKQIANAGAFQLQLTGGEVFIRGNGLFEILDRTEDLGLAVVLSTNGVWKGIHDKNDFIKRLSHYRNIVQIKIALEGKPEIHNVVRKTFLGEGSYDDALDTLRRVANSRIPRRINTVIFKSSCNHEQLDHLAGLAQEYGADLQLVPLRPVGKAINYKAEVPEVGALYAYTKYATELRQKMGVRISFNFDIFDSTNKIPVYYTGVPITCSAGVSGLHITHNGEVYPCGFSIGIENKKFLAGKISKEINLLDIWFDSKVFQQIRNAGKSETCKSSEHYGKGCWGGCWVDAYMSTGKLNGSDPHCLWNYEKSIHAK